jgi:mRNA interferase MazF
VVRAIVPVHRGEIWIAALDPVVGHEQAGTRPVLVLSENIYNQGPAGLVFGIPITSKLRSLPHHLRLQPPEGGLTLPSSLLCDGLRSLSRERLVRKLGVVSPTTLAKAEDILKILLGLA